MAKIPVYSDKQNEVYAAVNSGKDWYMLMLDGAVRAGKTKMNNDIFLDELLRVRDIADSLGVATPKYILAAASSSTLQTNILDELENDYGLDFKFDRNGNFTLFGVKVVTTFTGNKMGLKAIRGMTAYGAYINEATLADKRVFDEIKKRCSGDGARIIFDTNPDHPEHYIKKDYIDKADGETLLHFNFTIFDNPYVSKRYVENLIKTTPSGVFTERGIYGRWTIGEGAVYADFNQEEQVIAPGNIPHERIEQYVCGVDWGYEHKGVIVLFGVDDEDNWYLIEEHVYKHKHIDDWIEIARDITERYGDRIPFYCDSARPEYVDAFFYAGLNAHNANKSVMPGISEMGKLIKSRKFFVSSECKQFLLEVNQYVWASKGDVPIKEYDDCMDACRYGIYTHISILDKVFE